MKKIILLLFFPAICFAQKSKFDENLEDGKYLGIMPVQGQAIVYSGVVILDSTIKKNEFYNRAKRFFVDSYKSAKDVIQLDDKEGGELIGKGNFTQMWQASFMEIVSTTVSHTLKIWVKDGKYKYEISNLSMEYYEKGSAYTSGGRREQTFESLGGYRKNNAKKYLKETDTHILSIISSLKAAMSAKSNDDF